ncbi:MAG: SpoIIE family protein phosphatase [Streptosporangiales bacterium]|nr:SpoIIE family protein phosphatase [Streptosporangiales bacterium]
MTHRGEMPHQTDPLLPADTVLDQAQIAVIVTDRFSNLLYWNAFAAEMFGFAPDQDYIGMSALEMGIAEEDHEAAQALAMRVLRGDTWQGTFTNQKADGSRIYVRAQAVPLKHPSGAIEGIVILAHEALRDNRRDEDRFGLLDRIGGRLAGSLEFESTVQAVAATLVPQFADHCFIDLFENDRLIRRVSMHAGNWVPPPGSWVPVGEEIVYPPGHFCKKAMDRLETIVIEDLRGGRTFPAPTERSFKAATDIHMTSVIAAPLRARGELLGVMCLGLSHIAKRRYRHYDDFDKDFVGAVASRVALAIDNARLFEEERDTALAFQTSLLPRDIPDLDGLTIACRYFPAKPLESHGQGIQTQVGGDWYDVIPLSAGRVGIVIGDVEGRGAHAAAVMGQLRAAVRAFAQDDKSPADILQKLDEWVRMLGKAEPDGEIRVPTVSCIYMVYDAWSRKLSFANAGHAIPFQIVDGQAGLVEMSDPGVLLGARVKGASADAIYTEEMRELPPGATLLLYTDGLVERRPMGGTIDQELAQEMLRERLNQVADFDVEHIADAASDAVPGDIDDDMAVLVVRTSAVELASRERTFAAEPIMVGEARRMAAETLAEWKVDRAQGELACLLISEVVTNVVLHAVRESPQRELVFEGAAGPAVAVEFDESWDLPELSHTAPRPRMAPREFTLRLRRGAASIWVEVFDQDLRLPRIRSAGENDEGGRGLYLVDQLANRWGSRPTKEGKAVWFELPADGA